MTVRSTIKQLFADYGTNLRVVYKHFIVHRSKATPPALALCAADQQGGFEAMEALIWDKGYKMNDLSKSRMEELAKEIGLDVPRLDADMQGHCKQILERDRKMLSQFNVRGVPTVFINGRLLTGARPIDQFRGLIDEELRKAEAHISSGDATVKSYYDKYVVKRGKKTL